MRKSYFWLTLILFIAGCRYLPTRAITSLPIETEMILNTPGIFETPTIAVTQTPFSITQPTFTQTPSPLSSITATPVLLSTSTRLPFELQGVTPVYVKNFNHPDSGCNWLGVAGQIFNEDGKPIDNQVVVIKGKLGEAVINSVMLTGLEAARAYGPGGYEIILSDKVIGITKSLVIYVNDLLGNRLTPVIEFDTFADCNKNLIIINFKAIN